MQFANTEYFQYAWWLIPGVLVLWFYSIWRKRKIASIAKAPFLPFLLPGYRSKAFLRSGILILISLALIIIALANPVGTSKPVKGKTNGLDIVFALDVSKSMDAQDVKPSRLEHALHTISDLSEKLAGNKLGLVVFAGNAYVQMPLTTDANAMKLFLSNITTNIIPEQGTSLESAIETSKELLFPQGVISANKTASKVIILLTDGEDHNGDAAKAANEVSNDGIVIMTIGMGTTEGAPIPIFEGGLLQGYLKDNNGETIVTKMDATDLKNIASTAHGSYFEINQPGNIENEMIKKLNTLSKGEESFELFDLKETHFQWFAGSALFLLLLEIEFINIFDKRTLENEA
jgi:Ca-activated chloride channel family protein